MKSRSIVKLFLMTVLMMAALVFTSFAATSSKATVKSSYPAAVKTVLQAWNKNPVDGYECYYDESNKVVIFKNTDLNKGYTVKYAAVDSVRGKRMFAELKEWEEVIDNAQKILGSKAIATLAITTTGKNVILYYTKTTQWQTNY